MSPRIRRTPVTPPQADGIDADIALLHNLRNDEKQIKVQIVEVQDRIVDALQQSKQKSLTITSGTKSLTALMQTNTTRTIDEDKLKRKMGPSLWRKATTLILDRKKLDALIKTGDLDPIDVADCVEESESKPFIKVSAK